MDTNRISNNNTAQDFGTGRSDFGSYGFSGGPPVPVPPTLLLLGLWADWNGDIQVKKRGQESLIRHNRGILSGAGSVMALPFFVPKGHLNLNYYCYFDYAPSSAKVSGEALTHAFKRRLDLWVFKIEIYGLDLLEVCDMLQINFYILNAAASEIFGRCARKRGSAGPGTVHLG